MYCVQDRRIIWALEQSNFVWCWKNSITSKRTVANGINCSKVFRQKIHSYCPSIVLFTWLDSVWLLAMSFWACRFASVEEVHGETLRALRATLRNGFLTCFEEWQKNIGISSLYCRGLKLIWINKFFILQQYSPYFWSELYMVAIILCVGHNASITPKRHRCRFPIVCLYYLSIIIFAFRLTFPRISSVKKFFIYYWIRPNFPNDTTLTWVDASLKFSSNCGAQFLCLAPIEYHKENIGKKQSYLTRCSCWAVAILDLN